MITWDQINAWTEAAKAAGTLSPAVDPIQMISQGIAPDDPRLKNLTATQEGTLSGNPTVGAGDFYNAGFKSLGDQYTANWRRAEADNGGLINQAFNIGVPLAMSYFGGGALANGLGASLPTGNSMSSFFPDILDVGGGVDMFGNPLQGNFAGGSGDFFDGFDPTSNGAFDVGGGVDQFGNPLDGRFQGGPGTPGANDFYDPSDTGSLWDSIVKQGGSALKSLFGGAANTLTQALPGGKGGSDFLSNALASAPVLAAISYARNQSPFDTSRLESAYNRIDPNALTFQYDQNTGLGREALTSSLASRNVLGSSFGDQSLTSYNTNRDLGRNALLTQGASAQGDVANKILQAQVQSQQLKNQLYGSALGALGNIFRPRASYGTA